MTNFRRNGTDVVWTVLRAVVGIIFIAHGAEKLGDPSGTAQAFAQMGVPVPSLSVWFAILGEFVGGLGLLLGAFTPLAAAGPLITMLGAIVWVHVGNGLYAQKGGYEYPLTMLLVSALFLVGGAGPFSIDAWLKRIRAERLLTQGTSEAQLEDGQADGSGYATPSRATGHST
jgi:putative oxidoreductase